MYRLWDLINLSKIWPISHISFNWYKAERQAVPGTNKYREKAFSRLFTFRGYLSSKTVEKTQDICMFEIKWGESHP